MSGRADVVCGSPRVDGRDPEHGSGVGPASTWPLTSSLVLGALDTAPSCARLHAGAVLREWGLAELADTAELVVSELVTNAVQASTGPRDRPQLGLPVVRVRLMSDRKLVMIEVWDTSTDTPILRQPESGEEAGRGLMLVEALCQRWGWKPAPDSGCKVVWAELQLPRVLCLF